MSCLDNIVTLGLCDDEPISQSGLTLMMASGMSPKNLQNTATEQYISGKKLAEVKKQLALTLVENDFLVALAANRVIPQLSYPSYATTVFKSHINIGNSNIWRGLELHKNTAYRGKLRKTHISEVQLYPLASGTVSIKITDGFTEWNYTDVSVIANQVNNVEVDVLINSESTKAKILVDQSVIPFASGLITCMTGCSGTMPNECGYANGFDGNNRIKSESYGVGVIFDCACDYRQIMCDLGKSYFGQIIWLKWQYLVYDEQYKSNRFTSWVIYNRDDIPKIILPDIDAQYTIAWNGLMNSLLGILNTYRDDCLNCRGVKKMVFL